MSQIAHIRNFFNMKEVELADIADVDIEMAKHVKKSLALKAMFTKIIINFWKINLMEL